MTFPPPPPTPPTPPQTPPAPQVPPPAPPGSGYVPPPVPAPKKSSSLVPLLIVGAIVTVLLMAGAAATIILVLMNRGAFSPAGPAADSLPAADAPVDAPPEAPPDMAPAADAAAPADESAAPEPAPSAEASPDAGPPAVPTRERTRGSTREPVASAPAVEAPAEREGRAARAEEAERDDEPVERAVRAGGNIKVPTKLRNVQPVYPQIAQQARIEGVVIIEATIGRDGRVSGARVLRSIPLLDQAALDAVRQWEYEPTLLNGVAVPVIVTVTVNFSLGR